MFQLKAFYVDLLVPLETNLEKDTKVVQVSKPCLETDPRKGHYSSPSPRLFMTMNNATPGDGLSERAEEVSSAAQD